MPATLPLAVRTRLDLLVETRKLALPVLPRAVSRLLVLVESPNCTIESLANVIRSDAMLAAHILRMAATPVYATSAKIVSLPQVIGRLGFAAIRQIAMFVTSHARVFEVPGFETEVRAMFKHSFTTALFAQELARTLRTAVEPAFIAGLLADIGRPLLLQAILDVHRQLGLAPDREAVLAAAGEAHAELGGAVVDHWGLSPQVAEAIRKHHAPDGVPLAMIVALADTIAEGASDRAYPDLAAPLNLYPDDVEALIARKSEEIAATVLAMT